MRQKAAHLPERSFYKVVACDACKQREDEVRRKPLPPIWTVAGLHKEEKLPQINTEGQPSNPFYE